jgi:tetratricopeptide (TPR) repeat protein
VAAAPNDTSYYDTLAKVYEKVGKRDRAIATYQKILDLDPVNVQAMVPTIRLLRDEGRRDDARAMLAKLETVLQSNPALRTPDVDVQSLRQQL